MMSADDDHRSVASSARMMPPNREADAPFRRFASLESSISGGRLVRAVMAPHHRYGRLAQVTLLLEDARNDARSKTSGSYVGSFACLITPATSVPSIRT